MSLSDLAYIRALLVAQTVEPEPRAKGLFGRLFAGRAEPGRSAASPSAFVNPSAFVKPLDLCSGEGELLLEHTFRPRPELEAAPPLAPPSPRAEFGRRSDAAAENELVLDRPAAEPRRLTLLDPSGQAVGEMILEPEEPAMRLIATVVREEVPYFPEDFLDHGHSHSHSHGGPPEPEPLRPWLKALRNTGMPRPAAAEPAASTAKPTRRRPRSRPQPVPTRVESASAEPASLGHDLLEALALTLAREHETLDDRLFALAQDGVFQPMAEAEAA